MVKAEDKKSVIKLGYRKILNRPIIKQHKTIVKVDIPDNNLLSQMDRDKSRFFKNTWDEEKRSLFFK